LTTEQADFEVNVDAKSWRELIMDNPFEANKPAQEQAPRDSLMMMAEAGPMEPFPSDDSELVRSDRFAQRIVSLGPHSYPN
jgi:hypothetical protein